MRPLIATITGIVFLFFGVGDGLGSITIIAGGFGAGPFSASASLYVALAGAIFLIFAPLEIVAGSRFWRSDPDGARLGVPLLAAAILFNLVSYPLGGPFSMNPLFIARDLVMMVLAVAAGRRLQRSPT